MEQHDAIQMIYDSLDELNADRSPESRVALAPATRLLGEGGQLDSLDIVNLVVRLEALLAERLQRAVVLVDEQVFTEAVHPFRDVETLSAYLVKKSAPS